MNTRKTVLHRSGSLPYRASIELWYIGAPLRARKTMHLGRWNGSRTTMMSEGRFLWKNVAKPISLRSPHLPFPEIRWLCSTTKFALTTHWILYFSPSICFACRPLYRSWTKDSSVFDTYTEQLQSRIEA